MCSDVRHRLPNGVAGLDERRDLLTRVVVAAAKANRELETQTDAFHQMRDLVFNAPERLDALTQQLVTTTARLDPSEQKLTALKAEGDAMPKMTGGRIAEDTLWACTTSGWWVAISAAAGACGSILCLLAE